MNLSDAYDAEFFREQGHRVIDLLADYLRDAIGGQLPVLPHEEPEKALNSTKRGFSAEPSGDLVDILNDVIRRSNHLHHPRYIGHQVSVPLPLATLAELTSALLNNGMAVFEMGQLQTVMEIRVVDFLNGLIGFESGGGLLTHGGSLGNLTALLAARQAKAGHDVWADGGQEPFSFLVSSEAHYSISRATRIMGWGEDGAVSVPVDKHFRMNSRELQKTFEASRARGRKTIGVVASSCSTATGTYDNLPEIADFCASNDLWLHVDGAHGASAAISPRQRHLVRGIERADSVVWDLHKLLALPALNTAVLFRDRDRSYQAFAQEASYLFGSQDPRDEWFHLGHRTFECTKRGLSVTAFCMFTTLGIDFFAEHVDRLCDLAALLAGKLQHDAEFELAVEPESNIVCFRHRPAELPTDQLDAHQAAVRKALVESGDFYLVQTRMAGETWLRASLMNPLTTDGDLDALLESIRSATSR